jgi:hypothetical protein
MISLPRQHGRVRFSGEHKSGVGRIAWFDETL